MVPRFSARGNTCCEDEDDVACVEEDDGDEADPGHVAGAGAGVEEAAVEQEEGGFCGERGEGVEGVFDGSELDNRDLAPHM